MYGGRGRGRGGFGYRHFAKEEDYELFPKIEELPDFKFKQEEKQLWTLITWSDNLTKFWNSSPYNLKDPSKEIVVEDNERVIRKPPLSDYMMMTSDYVPGELVGKNVRHSKKKTRWDLHLDLERLDLFEKMEFEGKDEEKKEDEEEEEENENSEDEEDDSDDGYQNNDFEDDEDENNMNDDYDDDAGCY